MAPSEPSDRCLKSAFAPKSFEISRRLSCDRAVPGTRRGKPLPRHATPKSHWSLLEHFRVPRSEAVAAMSDVMCAFVGHEESEGHGHEFADVIEGARAHGT